MIQEKVTITISKTRDGANDYLQVMSGDMISLNIVVVASAIEVRDDRARPSPKNLPRGRGRPK